MPPSPRVSSSGNVNWQELLAHLDAQNALRDAMEQRILAKIETALGGYKADNEIAHQKIEKDNELAHGKLETRINSWSVINSFGIVIALILDYFGIKRP